MPSFTTQAIKTRQNKLTRRLKKLPSLGQAVVLLVIGLLIGTVFTVLMHHTQGPVAMDEARPISAVMKDVRGNYGRRNRRNSLREILIRFEEHAQLKIDDPVANQAMLDKLMSVEPGSTFDMLVHPNSATILSLHVDGKEIINFDTAMAKLRMENTAFFWMGVCAYVFAIFSAYVVILRIKLRRY